MKILGCFLVLVFAIAYILVSVAVFIHLFTRVGFSFEPSTLIVWALLLVLWAGLTYYVADLFFDS